MKKFLKWTLISVGTLAIVLFGVFKFMQYKTKQASPETVASYNKNGKKIAVEYSSPSKKGREIFGNLVAYGKVWRTGANEATTFTTETDLEIKGQQLPKGEYTLWTIPEKEQWTVIFNGKQYGWGVNFDGEATREPQADVLQIKVPIETLPNTVEQFTIAFEETPSLSMTLAWDKTKVAIPLQ